MSTEKYYTPVEERINVITHGFGFILALLGSILLLNSGLQEGII